MESKAGFFFVTHLFLIATFLSRSIFYPQVNQHNHGKLSILIHAIFSERYEFAIAMLVFISL